MERQNAEQWDGVKLDILAQAYMEVRREMWTVLANRVGEKWQLVEQKVCNRLAISIDDHRPDIAQCMEKGIKNLTQASRSAQKKQNDGIYHDHDDSGVGVSDLDEESEDHHHPDMSNVSPVQYPTYPGGYPSQQHQRVPSIQSMLHPHPMQYANHHFANPQ